MRLVSDDLLASRFSHLCGLPSFGWERFHSVKHLQILTPRGSLVGLSLLTNLESLETTTEPPPTVSLPSLATLKVHGPITLSNYESYTSLTSLDGGLCVRTPHIGNHGLAQTCPTLVTRLRRLKWCLAAPTDFSACSNLESLCIKKEISSVDEEFVLSRLRNLTELSLTDFSGDTAKTFSEL